MQDVPNDLVELLTAEAQRFTKATGIPCELDAISVDEVPERTVEHARRIVAEALINVARHAQAQHAWLKLSRGPDFVEISIRDDGIGFEIAEQSPTGGHYGLLGMRERARLTEGVLEINTLLGRGTTVMVRLPLTPALDGE